MDDEARYARVLYHYERTPEAKLQTAHGVWGGINGHGEIEICFYNESDRPPACVEQVTEPDGTVTDEIVDDKTPDTRHVVRNIHSRVLLNYETARSVLDWLEDRLYELEEAHGFGDFYGDKEHFEQ